MFYRRLSDHLKQQNWLAAGIDLVIVVLGILIGLQINAWHEQNKERQLEVVYLNRFASEIKTDIQFFNENREKNNIRVERILLIIDAVENGFNKDRKELVYLLKSIKRIEILRRAFAGSATWDELVSTGRIDLITDVELKARMSEYYQYYRRMSAHGEVWKNTEIRYDTLVDGWFSLEQVKHYANQDFDRLSNQDLIQILDKALADKEFLSVLSSLTRKYYLLNRINERDKQRTVALLNEIEQVLARKNKASD